MSERLLPGSPQTFSGLQFAGKSRQAFFIGGDSFDFIHLPNGQAAFIICDVSGKGITAALIWAALRANLRRETSQPTANPAGLITRLDHLVRESSPESRYTTLFYAQYDPQNSRLQYVNAGHPPPFLLRAKPLPQEPVMLTTGGLPIGLPINSYEYEHGEVILRPGDVVIAYTDGMTEGVDAEDPEQGLHKLVVAASDMRQTPFPEVIVEHLFSTVDAVTNGDGLIDDMTVIAIKAVG